MLPEDEYITSEADVTYGVSPVLEEAYENMIVGAHEDGSGGPINVGDEAEVLDGKAPIICGAAEGVGSV